MTLRTIEAFWHSWWRALALPFILFILWLVSGWIFSLSLFDSTYFEWTKVLDRDGVLSFMGVILAVQIPIFILFLETMKGSGYIYKVLLPTTTRFREIVIILITCGLLVLISPRESYLYATVAFFLVANIYAVIQAFEVVFRMEGGYERKVKNALRQLAKQAFSYSLTDRIMANKSYAWVKDNSQIISLEIFGDKSKEGLLVHPSRSGYLKGVRIRYSRALIKVLSIIYKDVRVDLRATFSSRVKPSEALVALSSKRPVHSYWTKLIRRMFIIADKNPYVTMCERIFDDFESRLLEGVKSDSKRIVVETLDMYHSLIDALDELVQKDMVQKDSNYNLEQAFNDVRGGSIFSEDGLSHVLHRAYEVVDDATTYSIKASREETGKILIGKSYTSLYSAVSDGKKLGIARNEALLRSVLERYIYDSSLRDELTDTQKLLRSKIISFAQEGTSMITWQIKEKDIGEAGEELIAKRIESLRNLVVGAYKNDMHDIYDELVSILLKLDSREDSYLKENSDLSQMVSSTLFMILAYLLQRGDLASDYAEPILSRVKHWRLSKLTETAIRAVDDGLSHEWRFDGLDLPHDGQMHSVPDFDAIIRKLWVLLVSESHNPPSDTAFYGDEQLIENTLFFTNGASDAQSIDMYNILDGLDIDSAKKDKVRAAIGVLADVRFSNEGQVVAEASLDTEKVRVYTENADKTFAEDSDIMKIFDKAGQHYKESGSKAGPGYKEVALNTVFEKQAFMDHAWHIGYSMEYQGGDVGRNLATGLDRALIPILLADAHVVDDIDKLLEKVKAYSGDWIVISNRAYDFESRQKLNKIIVENDSYFEQRIKGVKQKLPILTTNIQDLASGLYFMKRSEIGTIVHPKNDNEYLLVNIKAYSDNQAMLEKLLEVSPPWLQEKGDLESQRKFLLTQVHLYVAYVFEHELPAGGRQVLHYPLGDNEDL